VVQRQRHLTQRCGLAVAAKASPYLLHGRVVPALFRVGALTRTHARTHARTQRRRTRQGLASHERKAKRTVAEVPSTPRWSDAPPRRASAHTAPLDCALSPLSADTGHGRLCCEKRSRRRSRRAQQLCGGGDACGTVRYLSPGGDFLCVGEAVQQHVVREAELEAQDTLTNL
jgi:hypothetical protein